MVQQLKLIKLVGLFLILFLNVKTSLAFNLRENYEQALDAYNSGQYEKSILLYKEINREAPQFAPAYIGVGLCLIAKGAEYDEVLFYYKQAVDKDPKNSQAYDQLGRLYYANNQIEKAKIAFENALKINPSIPQVKLSLAWINITGKKLNPTKAIRYFKEVIDVNPVPNAIFGLGMAYFADNQREKVLEIITDLKSKGETSLAEKLEKSLRDNKRVVLNEIENQEDDNQESQPMEYEKTEDVPKGIKVRLRSNINNL